jgi:hypothetical protein
MLNIGDGVIEGVGRIDSLRLVSKTFFKHSSNYEENLKRRSFYTSLEKLTENFSDSS